MSGPKYSLGYNFDYPGFIALIERYAENIESVYFPIPKKYLGSGRILDEPVTYGKDIISLIDRCNALGIRPFLILNSTLVTAAQVSSVIDYVLPLYDKGVVRDVTVTEPYLMMQIRKKMPQMFIEASTLCRIKNVQEAKYFKEIGANRFTSDRETIRDLKVLKELSKVMPVKILANEGCIKNCIYKYAHYNMLSANTHDEPRIPIGKRYDEIRKAMDEMDSMCVNVVKKHPYKIFSSPFIRPEDIRQYAKITDIVKLSTRNFTTKRIDAVLNAYINQRYDGNLVDLLNTAYIHEVFEYIDNSALNNVNFFKKLSTCNDDCDRCNFCKELLVKTNAKIKNQT